MLMMMVLLQCYINYRKTFVFFCLFCLGVFVLCACVLVLKFTKYFLKSKKVLVFSADLPFRECPTSTSTEEEAIQGMLSMAGLHYSTCLQRQIQSTDCGGERPSLQDPSSCHSSNREVRQLYRCDKPVESGKKHKL